MVTKRIVRSHSVTAWVGDEERLERIVRLLQNLLPERKENDHEPLKDDWTAFILSSYYRPRFAEPSLVATATERGSVTLRGTPQEVFGEMDRTALQSLELEVSPQAQLTKRDQVRIEFDRVDGVKLESRGETKWVDEAHASLVEELDRGRTWWWWLRDTPALLTFLSLGVVGFWLLAEAGVLTQEGDPQTLAGQIALTATIGLLVSGLLSLGLGNLIRRFLPGFEVVLPGEKGRGARALAVIGTVLIAAIGIGVNLITTT